VVTGGIWSGVFDPRPVKNSGLKDAQLILRLGAIMIILIIILILLFGGGGGYYGHTRWGPGGGAGIGLGTILVILLIAYLLGLFR
jgi:hypothetical protein